MTTQTANRSLAPLDDLLLAAAEASAHAVLAVETLRHRAERRQFRTVKGDGLDGLHRSSGTADQLAPMRSTVGPAQRAAVDQLANSDNAAVLERTMALLREQVTLITRLFDELVEERRRRGTAEGVAADLQRQLAELERSLCAAASGLTSEDDGTVEAAQEMRVLAKMEDQAKDWRKRSRRRPRSARRWLRRSVGKLLARLFNGRPPLQ